MQERCDLFEWEEGFEPVLGGRKRVHLLWWSLTLTLDTIILKTPSFIFASTPVISQQSHPKPAVPEYPRAFFLSLRVFSPDPSREFRRAPCRHSPHRSSYTKLSRGDYKWRCWEWLQKTPCCSKHGLYQIESPVRDQSHVLEL